MDKIKIFVTYIECVIWWTQTDMCILKFACMLTCICMDLIKVWIWGRLRVRKWERERERFKINWYSWCQLILLISHSLSPLAPHSKFHQQNWLRLNQPKYYDYLSLMSYVGCSDSFWVLTLYFTWSLFS